MESTNERTAFDVGNDNRGCEYCGNSYRYNCYNHQYLAEPKRYIRALKKQPPTPPKFPVAFLSNS